jgi:hypothetical protein
MYTVCLVFVSCGYHIFDVLCSDAVLAAGTGLGVGLLVKLGSKIPFQVRL